jgi:hypothetical protein
VVNAFVVGQPKGPAIADVVDTLVAAEVLGTLVAAVVLDKPDAAVAADKPDAAVAADKLAVVVVEAPTAAADGVQEEEEAEPPDTPVMRLGQGPRHSSKSAAAASCTDHSCDREAVSTLPAAIRTEFGRIDSAVVAHHKEALDSARLVRFGVPRARRPNCSRPTNPLLPKRIQLLSVVQAHCCYPLVVHRSLNAEAALNCFHCDLRM